MELKSSLTIGLFVDNFYPHIDGVVMVVDRYARHLTDLGHKVFVLAPKNNGYIDNFPYEVLRCNSIPLKKINVDWGGPITDLEFVNKVHSINFDLIHVHSPFSLGKFAVKLASKKHIPCIATLHSQYKQDFYKATKSKLITWLLLQNAMQVYKKTCETWIMGETTRKILRSYGYHGPVRIVPNATELDSSKNINLELKNIETEYNLSGYEPIFIFVGRLVLLKNILFIADVLKILKDKGLNFKMLYVGSGADENILKEYINELNLSENIILTGMLEDRNKLAALYTRSDLMIFPSLYDTSSPLVQIEAAAFNTPAILIKNSAAACFVKDDVNGFTAEFKKEKFANKIMQIINDRSLLKSVGKQANKDLYINWTDVIKNVESYYSEIVAKHK
ncbi:MAG: glycosyltransferase [Clostridia bacterium]|jgi:glycosyltransferase involved in cell wall biosynthesis|nr:glycosyltransferase [Clostridia bacterium]MDD4275360.1 glycosyltransferase [Clostridia bacterium]